MTKAKDLTSRTSSRTALKSYHYLTSTFQNDTVNSNFNILQNRHSVAIECKAKYLMAKAMDLTIKAKAMPRTQNLSLRTNFKDKGQG